MRKTKKRRRGSGTAGIMIIVLAFLVVMTVQICRIRSKDAEYAAKEKEEPVQTDSSFLLLFLEDDFILISQSKLAFCHIFNIL